MSNWVLTDLQPCSVMISSVMFLPNEPLSSKCPLRNFPQPVPPINSILLHYNRSVAGNQTQCARVNQTISQGKTVPECYCDSKCSEYRDCCPKSTFKGDASKPFQNCTSFANGDFYVKRYCSNETWRKKCATNYSFVNMKNLKNKVPVTSLKTGLSFGNKFCATCYNVSDLQLWNVNVTCNDFSDFLTVFDNTTRPYLTLQRNLTSKFKYNKISKTWQITVANVTKNCTLRPAVPDSLKPMIRPCNPNVINKCTKYKDFQLLCDRNQLLYFDENSSKTYRNGICAWCSGATADVSVFIDSDSSTSGSLTANPTTKVVPSTNTVRSTMITTRFYPTPRPIPTRPRRTTSRLTTTTRSPVPKNKVVGHSYLHVSIQGENYSETLNRINMTKILAQTVYYSSMSRTYVRNFTEIEGSKIRTCNISDIPKANDNSQIPKVVPIAFNIVLILASAFLGISIRHFVTSQSSDNYQYRCIMSSFTIAVLLSNGGWFFKNLLNNSVDDLFNPFDHVVNYFAFLSSLMCTTTMAFHVSCTSWKAFYQFSTIKNNSQSKNLYLYSIINWFLPAIITMLENSTFGTFSILHLLIFFILPFIGVFSASLSFYVNSAILVAAEEAVEEKLQKLEINFKFFSALLGITHLMWLLALSFCYFKSYFLIVLFYVFNLIVCLLVYCVASGSKIFAAESVQFSGDKTSLVIVNKEE